jgi:hypothetical protein
MITSEEKAKELIYKFYYILPNNGSFISTKDPDELRYYQSVNCALITCDEVLGNMGSDRGHSFWCVVKDIIKSELSGDSKFWPINDENLEI